MDTIDIMKPEWLDLDESEQIDVVRDLISNAVLAEIAKADSSESGNVGLAAVERMGLEDQELVIDVARTATHNKVRVAAAGNIISTSVLIEIVKSDEDISMRAAAINRIPDQEVKAEVARTDPEPSIRAKALQFLKNQDVLEEKFID